MKYIFGVAVFMIGLLFSAANVNAALLTFTSDGEIYWNVLGLEDGEGESALEIKKIADDLYPKNSERISLLNEEGKVFISYGEGGKKIDVTGYGDEIIEIEEKSSPSKVFIEATSSGFSIRQRGVVAQTNFPIKINSPENKLTVETPTGAKFLSTLPYEAVRVLTNANLINQTGTVNIVEKEEGEVAYEVSGKKFITLFKTFTFEVPIKAHVSAVSGNVLELDQPLWYSLVGYFLT